MAQHAGLIASTMWGFMVLAWSLLHRLHSTRRAVDGVFRVLKVKRAGQLVFSHMELEIDALPHCPFVCRGLVTDESGTTNDRSEASECAKWTWRASESDDKLQSEEVKADRGFQRSCSPQHRSSGISGY